MKNLKFLNPKDIIFEQGANGYLSMSIKKRTKYETVVCTPLFPFSKPDKFVSVSVKKENHTEEIGVIGDLAALPPAQYVIVKQDIDFRYFTPEITEINKITSKHGIHQWDVVTEKGERTFFVRDIKENISFKENGVIVITDFDKCRYQIRNSQQLSLKSQLELEQTLL